MVVVGSGPAGVSAAEAFRRRDAQTPVLILTADTELPYARPPLSKEFLRGETDDIALHPEEWYAEHRIELVCARVAHIDLASSSVVVDERASSVLRADTGVRFGTHSASGAWR